MQKIVASIEFNDVTCSCTGGIACLCIQNSWVGGMEKKNKNDCDCS